MGTSVSHRMAMLVAASVVSSCVSYAAAPATLPTSRPNLQLRYASYFKLDPLTPTEITKLNRWIDLYETPKRSVWFVEVLNCGKSALHAEIFFKPTNFNDRVRRCETAYTFFMTDDMDLLRDVIKKSGGEWPPALQPFSQIASADPFKRDDKPPPETDVPFLVEGNFSDKEMLDAAAAARGADPRDEELRSLPIFRMQKAADGLVTVRLGWLVGRLAGRCVEVQLDRGQHVVQVRHLQF